VQRRFCRSALSVSTEIIGSVQHGACSFAAIVRVNCIRIALSFAGKHVEKCALLFFARSKNAARSYATI
jgi:hypothetical protein